MDWVPGWGWRHPAGRAITASAACSTGSWRSILRLAAELEELLGEPELAARNRKLADRDRRRRSTRRSGTRSAGISPTTSRRPSFSEHAQCLALLGGDVLGRRGASADRGPAPRPGPRPHDDLLHALPVRDLPADRADGQLLRAAGLWFDLEGRGSRRRSRRPSRAARTATPGARTRSTTTSRRCSASGRPRRGCRRCGSSRRCGHSPGRKGSSRTRRASSL